MSERAQRALPWLLPLIALLPDPGAALPRLSYYFRDFTVTFYPLRLFVARELREGRWPFWNPYLHEGTFVVPSFYPVDLLLALWPAPEFSSWLLTLHLPLAAVGAYALARELGQERPGAFVAGVVYSLGGFALSSLNLFVFLQALALAPLLAVLFRRAALRGGRSIAYAALVLGASIATLAVEFVAQGLILAWLLGLERRRDRRAVVSLALATGLGAALAAVPIAVVLGLLPETQRGLGFGADVALANEVHPFALVQAVVPGLFGPLDVPPGDVFWGGRFFSKGFPYFLSLYVGPAALALALIGAGASRGRAPLRLLLILGGLALLYALGERGGLAPLVARIPGLGAFRFPSKALFAVHFGLALLAGAGADAMRAGGARRLALLAGGLAAVLAGSCGFALLKGDWLGLFFFGAVPGDPAPFAWLIAAEIAKSAAVAALVGGVALAAAYGQLPLVRAQALVAGVVVLDLARGGVGLNPQVRPSLFDLPAEMKAAVSAPDAGRVFSFAAQNSRELRRGLEAFSGHRALLTFLLHRRALGHLTNILDRVETAWSPDVTQFGVAPAELPTEDYDPDRVASILPQLRGAAIQRIVSLDVLQAPGLRLRTEVASGVGEIKLRVYELDGWQRWSVSCRVFTAVDSQAALVRVRAPDFDGRAETVLETPVTPTCRSGAAQRSESWPGHDRFEVDADGAGVFVARDSWARGWQAFVDGRPQTVLRANGRQRAVVIPAGRHVVELLYRPPGLGAGLWVSGLAAVACSVLLLRKGQGRAQPPAGAVV